MVQDQEIQPRYRIDEGESSENEVKILSEEQARIIEKLLSNAGHALSGEERDLILRLVDKLNQETNRVRSLRKMTVGDKPLDSYLANPNSSTKKSGSKSGASNGDENEMGGAQDDVEDREEVVIRHTVGFKPEEVVQRYIECWNQQKFRAEYECFSREFMQIPQNEYVEARHNSYMQELQRGGQRIDFNGIVYSDTVGGESEIVATKTVKQGSRKPREEKDLFRLKLENGRWVIYSVEPQ